MRVGNNKAGQGKGNGSIIEAVYELLDTNKILIEEIRATYADLPEEKQEAKARISSTIEDALSNYVTFISDPSKAKDLVWA